MAFIKRHNLQNENSLSPKEYILKFISHTSVKHLINLRRPDSLITLLSVFAYLCMSTDKTYFCERYPLSQKMYNRQQFYVYLLKPTSGYSLRRLKQAKLCSLMPVLD